MKHLLGNTLLAVAALTCASLPPAQEVGRTQPSDREATRQAERERKEEERRRKAEEKEAQKRAGVRCARLRRRTGG